MGTWGECRNLVLAVRAESRVAWRGKKKPLLARVPASDIASACRQCVYVVAAAASNRMTLSICISLELWGRKTRLGRRTKYQVGAVGKSAATA